MLHERTIDTIDYNIVLNEKRWSMMNYSYPFVFDYLAVGLKRPAPKPAAFYTRFLVAPFNKETWIISSLSVILMIFALTLLERMHLDRYKSIFLLCFLCQCFIEIVFGLYAQMLTATATTWSIFDEDLTFDTLAEKVATKEFVFVTDAVNDFRFEFINKSGVAEVRKLRAALELNPPLVVNNSCDYLHQSGSVVYFMIERKFELPDLCQEQLRSKAFELLIVPIQHETLVMSSLVFSAESARVRAKMNELAVQGIYQTEAVLLSRLRRSMGVKLRISDALNDLLEGVDAKINFSDIVLALAGFYALLLLSAIVFVFELVQRR